MKKINYLILVVLSALLVQCKNESSTVNTEQETQEEIAAVTITKSDFGQTPDGEAVEKYTMANANGMTLEVITYGGIITSWTAPNKDGQYENIVLGYDNLEQYIENNPYFGALIGRFGNRIANGKFSIDGTVYQLETNDGNNHLHGGTKGFDKVIWTAEADESAGTLTLTYVSKDMEGGYPGTLTSVVTYTLTDENALEVDYKATTDKKTIVNLTQHSYFNLSGDFSKNILDHELTINADSYLPVDAGLIPTGALTQVEKTPFDFRTAKTIGQDIEVQNEQLTRGKGYDHCWVLNEQGEMRTVSTVYHPNSGRVMEIQSDEPGIQFYAGNFLDGTLPNPAGGFYGHRTGFCLETQHYPDSPNQADFPSVVLEPGQTYSTKTIFKFSTK